MQFIPFYLEMILFKLQFLININSISIISWVLLSISITISITKTGPYQYQYIINFSNFSLSISIPISISQFFPINISLSMHRATLNCRYIGVQIQEQEVTKQSIDSKNQVVEGFGCQRKIRSRNSNFLIQDRPHHVVESMNFESGQNSTQNI